MTGHQAIVWLTTLRPRLTEDQQLEMDDLVHDALHPDSHRAASINNQGLRDQLEYLLGDDLDAPVHRETLRPILEALHIRKTP